MRKLLFGATLVAFGLLFGCDQPQSGGAQASAEAVPCHCKPDGAPAMPPHVLHRETAQHRHYVHYRHRMSVADRDIRHHRFYGRHRRASYAQETPSMGEMGGWQQETPPLPRAPVPRQAGPEYWVDGYGRRYYAVPARSSYPTDVRAELSPWHGWYAGCDQ